MTDRQYAGWVAWESDEWNRPSRTDYELTAIRLEVVRMFASNPSSLTMDTPGVKIEFIEVEPTKEKPAKPPETVDEFSKRAAASWGAFLKGSKGRRPT